MYVWVYRMLCTFCLQSCEWRRREWAECALWRQSEIGWPAAPHSGSCCKLWVRVTAVLGSERSLLLSVLLPVLPPVSPLSPNPPFWILYPQHQLVPNSHLSKWNIWKYSCAVFVRWGRKKWHLMNCFRGFTVPWVRWAVTITTACCYRHSQHSNYNCLSLFLSYLKCVLLLLTL